MSTSTNSPRAPRLLAAVISTYLLLLLVAGIAYVLDAPPVKGWHAPVVLQMAYWGTLGAVLISVQGLIRHGRRDWDHELNTWHVARPMLGAVVGTVAYLAARIILVTIGEAESLGLAAATTEQADLQDTTLLALLAFLVGYREENFRTMVARVTDIIFGPGQKPLNDRTGMDQDSTASTLPQAAAMQTVSVAKSLHQAPACPYCPNYPRNGGRSTSAAVPTPGAQ